MYTNKYSGPNVKLNKYSLGNLIVKTDIALIIKGLVSKKNSKCTLHKIDKQALDVHLFHEEDILHIKEQVLDMEEGGTRNVLHVKPQVKPSASYMFVVEVRTTES